MKLTTTDLNYINHRMKTYDIKYQEIYDEINDHIILAVEDARKNGDERNISNMFDEVVEVQFPGYWAFEDISKEYEKAYRDKIRKMLWANMRYYLDWRAFALISILSIAGFYFPQTTATYFAILAGLIVTAYIPLIYAWQKLKVINLNEGKQSLVKNHIWSRSNLLTLIGLLWFNTIGNAAKVWDIPSLAFLSPVHYNPAILILALSFFAIYGLSSMRLCRQELSLRN